MAENKLEYGLTNVHVAVIESEVNGVTTYAKPFRIEGAVSFKQTPNTDQTDIYADNGLYHALSGSTKGEGSIEFIKLNDKFLIDVLGYSRDTKGGLLEDDTAKIKPFALLFEVLGDEEERRAVFFKCTPKKVGDTFTTVKDKVEEPKVELSLTFGKNAEGQYKYAIKRSENAETYNGFFTNVIKPVKRKA